VVQIKEIKKKKCTTVLLPVCNSRRDLEKEKYILLQHRVSVWSNSATLGCHSSKTRGISSDIETISTRVNIREKIWAGGATRLLSNKIYNKIMAELTSKW
jgi:hypothetical protein